MVKLAVALLGLLAMAFLPAQAGGRVALVVGNAAYEQAGRLANPVNDAADVAAALRAIGFTVIEGSDLGKRALERAVGAFADALAGADVGLFFYAGHGIQVDGRNYLLPVDARLDVPAKLRLEAVPMDDVIDIIESQARLSIVFLDACRNDPFPRTGPSSSRAATAMTRGLAQFDSGRGSFIAFSTAPGAVALDGAGRNSPFAAALLRHVATPAQSIGDMMIAVRRDVMAETRGTQRPWEQGSLSERFEFVPTGGIAAPPPPPQVAALDGASPGNRGRRSLGAQSEIEHLIGSLYLAPDAGDMRATVGRLYGDPALVYGTSYDFEALVSIKSQWFGAYRSWSLSLEPGTLTITGQGASRALASFDMRYDYEPKDAGAPRQRGRARVDLALERTPAGWRIVSETSQALP